MAFLVLLKHHCVLMLLLFLGPSYAQRYSNISLGSSLTPLGQNSSWLSLDGEFAFGFLPLVTDKSKFLLAIWFEKIASKTIVWYINGNHPVEGGSKVELTIDGQLSLKDHDGSEVWNAGITNASYAAMLNTGNFMLVNAEGSPRWQSFQVPSDTILPSQVLNLGSQLLARLMDDDYSSGRFILRVQTDGNLVLYTVAVPSSYQYDAYWASDTVGNGTRLIFNESGIIYFAQRDKSMKTFTSGVLNSMKDFYQRATLDADGVFRQYIHPRNGSGVNAWSDGWTPLASQPTDICQVTNSQTGSGACGFNSYCKISENQRVDCECPPQYSFLDPERKYKGCKPDFAAQSCSVDSLETQELYEFTVMTNVDWPSSDYEQYESIDEDQCRQLCLDDCFCAVAIYGDGNCKKKRLPLSIGRTGDYGKQKALVKVLKGNNLKLQPPSSTREKGKTTWILLGSLLLGASVFVLLIAILLMIYCSSSKKSGKLQPASSLLMLSLQPFTYNELKEATNGFREELGRGASSVVYKGILQDEARTCVAIKKLDKVFRETEKEFMNEVKTIAQTYHKNLVRLLGFCYEGAQRLLVYEYMSNGSLMGFLSENRRPEWNQRIQIAIGIARGLQYLHEECFSQVIHCDIKPQNILLDDKFIARISDFGLAKLLKTDQTRTNTDIRGTRGYVAPEWFKNIGITAKVDVYSFGVVLLEIICCRKNVQSELPNEEESILVYWVNDCFKDGRLDLVIEDDEQAILDMKRVERFVKVALWCIQEDPSLRPTMQKVTQMLDGSTEVPIPPDPSSYISSLQ